MLCGRELNGRMLVEIIKAYTESINSGALPNIENAWTYVKRGEAQKAYESSLASLEQYSTESITQPMTASELELFREKVREVSIPHRR